MSPLPKSPQSSSSQLAPASYDGPADQTLHTAHSQSDGPAGQSSHEMHSVVNMRLAEELQTVVVMNDKWQQYHTEQGQYVKDLQTGMDHQRKKIRELEKKCSQAITDKLQLEQKVKDQQRTIDSFQNLMEELDRAQKQIKILRLQEQDLQDELSIYKELPNSGNGSHNETVEMLQLQIQVCIDDFKKERKEKERYQNEITVLLRKLEAAQNILQDYQQKITIMRSINFPAIEEDIIEPDAAIMRYNTGYCGRNRIAGTAHSPTSSRGARHYDYSINFPISIVDDCAGSYHKGQSVELAATFPSLDSDDCEIGLGSDGIIGDRKFELVRH